MISAYVLLKIHGGTNLAKLDHVRARPEVVDLTFVVGAYDAVMRCEVSSLEALGHLAKEIRTCPAIAESVTCLAVE